MNGQSILISRSIRVFLWTLLALLAVIAILPWLIPTTGLGGFLLSMFRVGDFLPANHRAFGDAAYNFTILTRGFGIVGSIVSLLPLFAGVLVMIKMCRNYARNNVFSVYNANAYSKLGILYLLSAFVLQPVSQMFFSSGVSLGNATGPHFIAFGIDTSNLTAIIFSLLLIISGQVIKIGHKMAEEQKLIV